MRAAMLTDDDKQWMQAQLERYSERERGWMLAQLEKLETRLLTESHKPASPAELRRRTHAAVVRAMDLEAGLPPIG
jgi:hypothetical protein